MKKIFTLLSVLALAFSANAGEFVSPGNGTVYTLEDLSKIDSTGVHAQDGVWFLDTIFTISEGDVIRIQNNEVLKFGNKVQINIYGALECQPADTALVTTQADVTPKGFRLLGENSSAKVANTRFEYVGFNVSTANGKFEAQNCTFAVYNGSLSSGANINFSQSSKGHVIQNCNFLEGAAAAIGNGANTPVGITITNCYFYANNYKNSNRPQINLTVAGDGDVVISDNTLIGGHYTKVGGIAVSNMLGLAFSNTVTVSNNIVKENRYGITMTGPVNLRIIDNTIVDNIYETNAMNGGSAISLYDTNGNGTVYVKGNYMENNLWGITIIGKPNVNVGKVEDPNAADYNPGENIFKNNGNSDQLYDLYNNGTSTVYAQGNVWNVAKQDSASIEQVVTHFADNPNLGLVIFMPAGEVEPSSINDVAEAAPVESIRYFNILGRESEKPFEGVNIVVTRFTNGKVSTSKQLW